MRRSKYMPILYILLILGIGFGMPQLTSIIVNNQLKHQVVTLKNPDVSLQMTSDFFQTLKIFDLKQSKVELTEGYHLSKTDAEKTAINMLQKISDMVIDDSPEVTPFLITNTNEGGKSGIFWRCVWHSSLDADQTVWLDDKNGQIVSFQIQFPASNFSISTGDEGSDASAAAGYTSEFVLPAIRDCVYAVSEFCRLNYPVDNVKLAPASSSISTDEYNAQSYTLVLIRKENNEKETYHIPIHIRNNWLYFNS